MVPTLVFIALIVVVAIVIPLAIAHSKKVESSWVEAAATLGLRYRRGGFAKPRQMTGMVGAHPVKVDTYSRSNGKHSTTYTRFRIGYPALGLGLELFRQGPLAGVARFFGRQDIEVGDPAFDENVVVQGASSTRVAEFLTPVRRDRIRRLLEARRNVQIGDEEVVWSHQGLVSDAPVLVSTVHDLVRFARTMNGEADPIEPAVAARESGDLQAAVDEARAARSQNPFDPAPIVIEGESWLAAERFDEALEALQASDVADDPVIEEVRERVLREKDAGTGPVELVAEPEQVADAQTEPAGEPTGEPATPEGPSPEEVATAILDSGLMSSQANRLFDERFKGRAVRWSGTLQRLSPYHSDLVFRDGPGVRAVIVVHRIPTPFGDKEVQAVVRLAPGSDEELRDAVGAKLAFRGTLKKCDAFARNVFVEGGEALG